MSVEHKTPIELLLHEIEGDNTGLIDLCDKMMSAYGGTMYSLDIMAAAAVNRAVHLANGFSTMILSRNMTCAAAILRLHLDTVLRFTAAWIVENPHDFANKVSEGVPVRKMKDKNGQLMTDRYLVQNMSKQFDWMERVYDRTSGYVHFSETHMTAIFGKIKDESSRQVEFAIGGNTSPHFTDDIIIEALEAFRETTTVLAYYLHGWIVTKDQGGVTHSSPQTHP